MCVRALRAYGISRSIAHRSTLSAGHGFDSRLRLARVRACALPEWKCWRASQAVLIAIGIDWDGRRQVLAVELANRESRSSWRDFLLGLKARGLHGVEFVMADDHAGLRVVPRRSSGYQSRTRVRAGQPRCRRAACGTSGMFAHLRCRKEFRRRRLPCERERFLHVRLLWVKVRPMLPLSLGPQSSG